MARCVLPLALLLLACGSKTDTAQTPEPPPPADPPPEADPPPPESPEQAMVGHYASKHTVMVVCDKPDWCETEVEDRMSITRTDAGLAVSIELVQANAHTCSFSGTLAPAPTAEVKERWQWQSKEGEDGHPCTATLAFVDGQMRVTSEGCRYFCGARAHLDASFPYPPNAKKIPPCDESCTTVGVCWEKVNGGDYSGGGACVERCERGDGSGAHVIDRCIRDAADDCQKILACDE